MEKNTKILLGLAAAGVVAYLLLKPKKAVSSNNNVVSAPNEYQFIKGSQEEIAFENGKGRKYSPFESPENGDLIQTDFGYYKYVVTDENSGYWIKQYNCENGYCVKVGYKMEIVEV
jgi:hypothetical protein